MSCCSSRGRQFIAAFAATLGIFGLGNVLGWSSTSLPDIEASHQFANGILTDDKKSWIGSIAVVGALSSCAVAGIASDKFGRRLTMMIFTIPFVIGWLIVAFGGTKIWMILIGRFVSGFCGGAFSLSAPIYIAETSDDAIRGTMSTLFQLMLVGGILFSYTVGSFVTWSQLALISAIVPCLGLACLIFVPETPRYLMIRQRKDEAVKSLEWLRVSNHEEVHSELLNLEKSLAESSSQAQLALKDIFSGPILKPIAIVLSLMVFEQVSGYNAVIFYIGSIFKASGSTMNSNLCSILVGIVQVLATIVSAIFVDKAGRRILLLLGQIFMAIPLLVLGLFFHFRKNEELAELYKSLGWLPVVSLIVFISAFSLGIGPLSWTMLGELLAPNVKGLCSSIAVCLVWLSAFVVTKTFANISNTLGIDWCFWLYAITCVVGFVSIYFTVPETKGKSLDEIQKIFAK